MADQIRVIGVGPGNPDYITPVALNMIKNSDILVGGERVLELFRDLGRECFVIKNNLPEMVRFIRERRSAATVAVLASGDPVFYGILEYLKKQFGSAELLVVSGLSSIQLACARLCISWHDAALYSVHGREIGGLIELVKTCSKVVVLTDPLKTPSVLARMLSEHNISNKKIYVCENLSYENELIAEYNLTNVPENAGSKGCVVMITDE